MIPIKYIGHRETYRDGACGSELVFKQGQTLMVDDEAAKKMLRHPDVYCPGDVEQVHETDVDSGQEKAKPAGQAEGEDEQTQDLRDALGNMDKAALEHFAKTRFSVDIDRRKSVSTLRAEVIGMVDRFGAE